MPVFSTALQKITSIAVSLRTELWLLSRKLYWFECVDGFIGLLPVVVVGVDLLLGFDGSWNRLGLAFDLQTA